MFIERCKQICTRLEDIGLFLKKRRQIKKTENNIKKKKERSLLVVDFYVDLEMWLI